MVRIRMVSSLSAVTVEIAGDGGMLDKGCYARPTLGAIARHAQPLQTSRKAAPSTETPPEPQSTRRRTLGSGVPQRNVWGQSDRATELFASWSCAPATPSGAALVYGIASALVEQPGFRLMIGATALTCVGSG